MMHIEIPWEMIGQLSDAAWLRVVQLTAETAVAVANDLGKTVDAQREQIRDLQCELRRTERQLGAAHDHTERVSRYAACQRDAYAELAGIVARRLWHDLFREEAERLDWLLNASRKIDAIKEVRQFLGCSLGLAKDLANAREEALERG